MTTVNIALKFLEHRPLLAEHIRTYSNKPSVAFVEARRFSPEVRRDWGDKNVEMVNQSMLSGSWLNGALTDGYRTVAQIHPASKSQTRASRNRGSGTHRSGFLSFKGVNKPDFS